MTTTQLSIFIDGGTEVTAARTDTGTVYLDLDKSGPGMLTVFLDNDTKSKAGALAVLARLTAAVEALPDDTHAGQGVLPETLDSRPGLSPQARATLNGPDAPTFSINEDVLIPTAPVWRTLTFGDLRAGDVVKLDEDGPVETVNTSEDDDWGWWLATSQRCGHYYEEDPVLVRHPRPEVGQ